MRARRLLAAVVSAAVSLGSGPLSAQPKADAAAVADAKSHFEKGLKLYKEGAIREALAEFTQANKAVPRASVLRNIAQCHRDLKNFAAAYADYAELLKLYGPTLKPAETKQLKAALVDLAVLTGVVSIKVAEPDARVEIDGKDVGATPLEPIRVNVGTHQVAITKPGFDPIAKQVEIQGNDEAPVAGELKKEMLTGHVAVTAPGANEKVHLKVDDKDVGPMPWEGDLAPGPHRLDAAGDGLHAATRTVEVTRGARLDIALELVKAVGHLFVDPHIPDAEIQVDRKRVGQGVWEGELTPGQHLIAITAPGYTPYERMVLIHDGDRRTESVALERIAGRQDYRGVYANLDFALAVSPNPHNYVEDNCKALGCSTNGLAIGPATYLGVGYSFGYFGFEGLGYFRWDQTHEKQAAGGIDTTFNQFAFGGGIGARGFTKGPVARATLGFRFLVLHELITESQSKPNAGMHGNANATVPAVAWDLGLALGSTPGAKFKIGVVAQLEFFGGQVTEAKTTLEAAKGMQAFIGPTLGMQFGY